MIDIKLKQWTDEVLPSKSVEVGWETLQKEFSDLMEKARKSQDHDDIFDNLKSAVVDEAIKRHSWEDKAMDVLRVIQINALEDRNVHDKHEWDNAVRFFEKSVREKLVHNESVMNEMFGPSSTEKWLKWKYATEDQNKRRNVKSELDRILHSDARHPPTLSYDELTTVRKNLQTRSVEVDTDYIRETWYPIYRR